MYYYFTIIEIKEYLKKNFKKNRIKSKEDCLWCNCKKIIQ